MPATIDLSESDLAEVRRILSVLAPDYEVRAIGSRVTGDAGRYSDLDLALIGAGPVPPAVLERLRDAFSSSNLPIVVDVLDWRALTEEFRSAVGVRHVVLQAGDMEPGEEWGP